MKAVVLLVLILTVSVPAFAGTNPGVAAYISFDQSGSGAMVHDFEPTANEPFRAYVCFTNLQGGLIEVNFALTDVLSEYPGAFESAEFVSLLPGGLSIGDWRTGISLASTQCMIGPIVVAGYLRLVPLADATGCVEIREHPDFPRSVFDCSNGVDAYTLLANGAVGEMCCEPGDYDLSVRCEPQGPDNPTHPPHYWYDAQMWDWTLTFRVEVFDPDPDNYTNWITPFHPPEVPGTYGIEYDDGKYWAFWRAAPSMPMLQPNMRVGFDNPNPAAWGGWEFGSYSSGSFSGCPDGHGYRVHVPMAEATSVEQTSWSTVKALYR
jgi:hypothetical protein